MADKNTKNQDYLLVKVEGYSANGKYMYARKFPSGEKISITGHSSVKSDFIGYLANTEDNRHAPKGSVIALFNVSNPKDNFHVCRWAKAISKKPQSEDVIVTPMTVSPVLDLGNGKTQVLARALDPIPFTANKSSDIRAVAKSVIEDKDQADMLKGNRGFMVRVHTAGQGGVESACFKGIPNLPIDEILNIHLGGHGKEPSKPMKALLNAINRANQVSTAQIEVVGFTDAPVFNFGNSKNDEDLANTPNFKVKNKNVISATFSNAAITIDKQGNNKILRVTALPDKNIISDMHGLVGNHDRNEVNTTPYLLPKTLVSSETEQSKQRKRYPVTITPYIDKSNQKYNSILVTVNDDAPDGVHQRVVNAISGIVPRKGAGGYFFDKKYKNKINSALSDLAGTPALYTTNGSIGEERYTFIAGRTNEPEFKAILDDATKTSELTAFPGGLYGVPENKSIQSMSLFSELLKKPASSELAKSYLATKPENKQSHTSKPRTQRESKPTYTEWLQNTFSENPTKIASDFDLEIKALAEQAGIDWDATKDNLIWPTINGKPESIKGKANVVPKNPADNGSCYVSTIFNSWLSKKGEVQYGIAITFTNLNKSRDERWTYLSHEDTYNRYSDEVWGNKKVVQKPTLTPEQLKAEQDAIEAERKRKLAVRIANADASKHAAFNEFSALPPYGNTPHRELERKQLPEFTKWTNAKAYTLKFGGENNRALAFAAYDIHERFVGYQYVTEEKLLLNKEKPEKKNSWSNKLFNTGFQKDDVRTGLPLGTHHTIGEINPDKPHAIHYFESYANAGSGYSLTNQASVICFDKDNMKKVIGLMSKKYPNHTHVHVADNDRYSSQKGNVGVMAALENAYNFNAKVVIHDVSTIPNFAEQKLSDASDLFVSNKRQQLLDEINNPLDVSDVAYNNLLKIQHCAESHLDEYIALTAAALESSSTQKDVLDAIQGALTLRKIQYSMVEPTYVSKYSNGITTEQLNALRKPNENAFDKVDYDLVQNTQTDTSASTTVASASEVTIDKTDAANTERSPWNVIVAGVQNPHPRAGEPARVITEISDTTGEHKQLIEAKLIELKVPYKFSQQQNKFYAPYKFINLINSGLSDVTGAAKYYAGRSKSGNANETVIRGDFTNPDNREEVESIVGQLGIRYNNEQMGYVIEDPNTFVFVKESLADGFKKQNPDVIALHSLEMSNEQQTLSNVIDKTAFSLGLEKSQLAKQQVKLNQHNPIVAELNSPLIAGVYSLAEQKVASSELAKDLMPSKRVFIQQRTLLTMLKSLHLTHPTLEHTYQDDVSEAIAILTKQMPVKKPQTALEADTKAELASTDKTSTTSQQQGKFDAVNVTETNVSEHTDNQANNDNIAPNDADEVSVESPASEEELEKTEQHHDLLSDINRAALQDSVTLQEQLLQFREVVEATFDNSQITQDVINESNDNLMSIDEQAVTIKPVEAPDSPHKSDEEIRLRNLLEFTQTYLTNGYTPEETTDALREPGSPYYDNVLGYQENILRKDIRKVHGTSLAKEYTFPKNIESPFLFIATVEQENIERRLIAFDAFLEKIVVANPTMEPKRISKYLIKGTYSGSEPHPYFDVESGFNKDLLKSDLNTFSDSGEVITPTAYFKQKQDEYLGSVSQGNTVSDDEVETQFKPHLISAMPPPPSLVKSSSEAVVETRTDDKPQAVIDNEQTDSTSTLPLGSVDTSTFTVNDTDTTAQVSSDLAVKSESIVDAQQLKEAVDNDNSDYDTFYQLALQCAKEQMSYEEFYESVFTEGGVYFYDNPFVVGDKLSKKDVVNALTPNGFKSPKSFYESAFIDAIGKSQSAVELTRSTGLLPSFVELNGGIGKQFDAVSTLLNAKPVLEIDKALEITKGSFSDWYNNGNNTIAVPFHHIFTENLNLTSAKELSESYTLDDIKLLADVMNIDASSNNSQVIAENTLQQWKAIQSLNDLTANDLAELPTNELHVIADSLSVAQSPSNTILAKDILDKCEELKQLRHLRIAQYSYVLSALTVEKEHGHVPPFVYRQLNSLLSEEANYRPLVENNLKKAELAKLSNAAEQMKQYIAKLSDAERRHALLTPVPEKPQMVGVENADIIGLGSYVYKVTDGDAVNTPKPPHMTGFAIYGDNLILAPAAFPANSLYKHNLQPVSNNALVEAYTSAQDLFDRQDYVAFSTQKGSFGVIQRQNKNVALLLNDEGNDETQVFKHKTFEKALEQAFDFFPPSSIEFTDGFSGNTNDDRLTKINSISAALMPINADKEIDQVTLDIATNIVEKANELNYKPQQESSDNTIQATIILDELAESIQRENFNKMIKGNASASPNSELMAYAASLASMIDSGQPEQSEEELNLNNLLNELSTSALRDLNTALTLEPGVSTADEYMTPQTNDDYLQVSDEEHDFLTSELEGEEIPHFEIEDEDALLENIGASLDLTDDERAFLQAYADEEDDATPHIENNSAELTPNTQELDVNTDKEQQVTDTSTEEEIAINTPVSYTLNGNVKFGYVVDNGNGREVVQYTYQDIKTSIEDSANHLLVTQGAIKKPIFAMDVKEYANAIKNTASTGYEPIDRILNNLDRINSLSVKELKVLGELTGVIEPNTGFILGNTITPLIDDYFKVNRIAVTPKDLVSNEQKRFVVDFFGSDTAFENIDELSKELVDATRERVVNAAYNGLIAQAEKQGISQRIINHEKNTFSAISVEKIENVMRASKKQITDIATLPTEVLNAKYTINNSAQINSETAQSHDNVVSIREVKETKGTEVYAMYYGNLVLANLNRDLLARNKQAELTFTDSEDETHVFSEDVHAISFEIETIKQEANSLQDEYFASLENKPVNEITAPYMEQDIDTDSAEYVFSHELANLMIEATKSTSILGAKIPKGYDLCITNNQYHIENTVSELAKESYDNINQFDDIKALNTAILTAKREVNNEVSNDKSNTLRSDSSESLENELPDTIEDSVAKQDAGAVHSGKTKGTEPSRGQDQQEADEKPYIEQNVHREHDSARSNPTRSAISSEDISATGYGIRIEPNLNFRYSDQLISAISSYKTESEAYEINLAAIKLAKELTTANRLATQEEKDILASYRGWGGLSRIFDNAHSSHSSKRAELNTLLSTDEYQSLKRSTLSAFYTSPVIVSSVWDAMEKMGLKGGLGLDPAFGVGNFASAIPESLSETVALQAKELDPLTAEIARHIHGPLVRQEGYEEAKIPKNTYDFAIGNVPFGDFRVHDKAHRDFAKHQIHDYFFLKSLDKVKPGGFVSFITSSGTLDKASPVVREKIAQSADLIGAIRLPSNAFSDNARTDVNSDIIFLQKREPNKEPSNTNWLSVGEKSIPVSVHGGYEEKISVNQYFIDNPDMVLGKQHITTGQYGRKTYRTVLESDLKEALDNAISKLPSDIYFEHQESRNVIDTTTPQRDILLEEKRLGSYQLDANGNVGIVIEEFSFNAETEQLESQQFLETVALKKAQIPRMKGLIELRDLTREHINLMLTESSDDAFKQSMQKLNETYDAFTKKFGELNKRGNKLAFKEDPDSYLILGLEHWDGKTAEKADIFTERTIYPRKEITHTDSVEDAVIISLSEKGAVVPEYIESLTDKKWPNIVSELGDSIFLNPTSMEWEHSSTYLSGHVVNKLKDAQAAVATNDIFKHNIESLKEVLPTPIPYYEIRLKLGSSWIPESDIQDFAKFIVTGENEACTEKEAQSKFKVAKTRGNWDINLSQFEVGVNSGRTEGEFGTPSWPADKLMLAILNNRSIVVRAKDSEGKSYIVAEATAEANAKADLIKDTFKQWIWEDSDRAARLEKLYNEKMNGYIETKYDGSKIVIDGLSPVLRGKEFKPRQNQLNAIQRYLVDGRALFLHDVGVGKSFALLGSIIKGKQVGKHNKALLTVPNPVFAQMQDLALNHFPSAKILMVDAKALNADNRKRTLSSITTNSWDAVIVSHSILPKIDIPAEFKLDLIDEELAQIEQAMNSLEDQGYVGKLSVKAHAKKLENARAKIIDRIDSDGKDDVVNIAEMGIDAIFVDEADEFVNLPKITNMNHVAGVNTAESKKAWSMYYLTQYMHHINGNQGVVLATGTDIRNNIGDQFTMLRFLAPDLLEEQDIALFDDFIGTFGEIKTQFEIAPEGSGFIEKTRLNKFYNLPELSMLYRQVADIVNAEDAGVQRPVITEKHVVANSSEELKLYMAVLAERAKAVRNGDNKSDNLLAIANAGRKIALDARFIHPALPDFPESKVNLCVENVLNEYHTNKALNPSQIIFAEFGIPNDEGKFDLYNDIKSKLAAGGIPEEKIVFARDYETDALKQKLQEQMNSGDIAVTIGTTMNMGVGKNVQERLAAIHDLSLPWRVRDMEQRGGRIERFGNIFENATRYKYSTEDSFDLFMWSKLKQKALFAAQTKRTPRDAAREFDEELDMSYSEIMSAATGNPLIEESITLEAEVDKLSMLQRSYHQAKATRNSQIERSSEHIDCLKADIQSIETKTVLFGDHKITLLGKPLESYEGNFEGAAKVINKAINDAKKKKTMEHSFHVGEVNGNNIYVNATSLTKKLALTIEGQGKTEEVATQHFAASLLRSLVNLNQGLSESKKLVTSEIDFFEKKIESLSEANKQPFEHGDKIIAAKQRLTEVQRLIAEQVENEAEEESDQTPTENWEQHLNEVISNQLSSDLNALSNKSELQNEDNNADDRPALVLT
ncbi:hypothetical protein [Pseudoalteromonas lipolytica]|uniref:hypothetical protein n=1 Tax=Pseudoalteromonas lipolytica TaxID=570156 RepID=UPI0030AF8710